MALEYFFKCTLFWAARISLLSFTTSDHFFLRFVLTSYFCLNPATFILCLKHDNISYFYLCSDTFSTFCLQWPISYSFGLRFDIFILFRNFFLCCPICFTHGIISFSSQPGIFVLFTILSVFLHFFLISFSPDIFSSVFKARRHFFLFTIWNLFYLFVMLHNLCLYPGYIYFSCLRFGKFHFFHFEHVILYFIYCLVFFSFLYWKLDFLFMTWHLYIYKLSSLLLIVLSFINNLSEVKILTFFDKYRYFHLKQFVEF